MARELLSLCGANKKASVDKVALRDERKSDAIQGSKKMGSKKKGSKKAEPPSTPSGLGEQVDLLAPSGVTVGAVLLHARTDQAAAPSPTPSVVLPLLPSQLPQPNSGVAPLLCRGEVCGGKGSVPRDARGPKGLSINGEKTERTIRCRWRKPRVDQSQAVRGKPVDS
eukprot:gene5184-33579_t